MPKFNRIHLVVMDSVGIGAAPDANNLSMQGYQMVLQILWDIFPKR